MDSFSDFLFYSLRLIFKDGVATSFARLLAITLHASEIAALPLTWPVMPAPGVGRAALIGASIQGTFLYADLYREGRV